MDNSGKNDELRLIADNWDELRSERSSISKSIKSAKNGNWVKDRSKNEVGAYMNNSYSDFKLKANEKSNKEK